MAQRRRKKRNPTPIQWAVIGVGAVALGAGGYAVYRVVSDRRRKKALAKLPRPPVTEPERPPLEGAAAPPPCGDAYPGFVPDAGGCVPTDATPPGIYVAEGCTDFVFVQGTEGRQVDYLEDLISDEIADSRAPGAESADPTALATDFLSVFWGECNWPPPPSGPQRIVQLYQAMVYVIGHEIVAGGGRVLGTSDPEIVDEQIAERLEELGFFDYDPDVVPEIEIPDALPEPGVQPPAVQAQFTAKP